MTSETEPRSGPVEYLFSLIDSGIASEQHRFEAASLAGEIGDPKYVGRLLLLLNDESDDVRAEALGSLVLRIGVSTAEVKGHCWRLLTTDPSDDARVRAATCLGKLLRSERDAAGFRRFVSCLKDEQQTFYVRQAIHRALFDASGRPPIEWPGVLPGNPIFSERDFDWAQIAKLEDDYVLSLGELRS